VRNCTFLKIHYSKYYCISYNRVFFQCTLCNLFTGSVSPGVPAGLGLAAVAAPAGFGFVGLVATPAGFPELLLGAPVGFPGATLVGF